MENNKKKILTLSFVVAGFLMALVARVLLETFAASFGAVARVYSMDLVKHGVPVTLGLATFFALQFNSKVLQWGDEVVTEISKIVWPSRKDTVAMTTVCCVMLLISGVVLGFFDLMSSQLVKSILGVIN